MKMLYAVKKEGKYVKSATLGHDRLHPLTKKYWKKYWNKKGYKFIRASSLNSAVGKAYKGEYELVHKKKKRSSGGFGFSGDIVGSYRLPSGGI